MVDGRKNLRSLEDWKKGIDSLKLLDCGFIAFYGAEPLCEFDKLPEIVGYAESIGIHTTIITSGKIPNFYQKLDLLYAKGAKSLSMSYDMVPLGKSSQSKLELAIDGLTYFSNKGAVRDVATIATMTRTNFNLYPQMILEMSRRGIWSFFDLIHWDRGQEGGKCKNYIGIQELLFKQTDFDDLVVVLDQIKQLKHQGYLVHTSPFFIEKLICQPDLITDYNWNCAMEDNFPAWVTVDVDMSVYPCDDFQPKQGRIFDLVNLMDEWDEFGVYWKPIVQTTCPGCLWNTHIDAHAIKAGIIPFTDYIHL
jgi:hypothetical protein